MNGVVSGLMANENFQLGSLRNSMSLNRSVCHWNRKFLGQNETIWRVNDLARKNTIWRVKKFLIVLVA